VVCDVDDDDVGDRSTDEDVDAASVDDDDSVVIVGIRVGNDD